MQALELCDDTLLVYVWAEGSGADHFLVSRRWCYFGTIGSVNENISVEG